MRKIIKLLNFIRYLRFFDEKPAKPYYLLVVDGPASISISRLILEANSILDFKCIVSAHFITRLKGSDNSLKNSMVGWQFTTVLFGLFRFLCLAKKYKKIPDISQVTAMSNFECITRYIENNTHYIKDVIVFNEKNPFTKLAVSTAKKNGIKTSCIQHGAVVENYFPIFVDRYFTWSEYYSNILQERVPGLNTVCVGRLDYVEQVNYLATEKNKIPLLVLQPADVSIAREELLSQFKIVIDVCYKYYDAIALRPHPSDNILPDILSYIGDRKFTIHAGLLGEVLSKYLIVISLYSTVLLEVPFYGGLPVQYLENGYLNKLMRRCDLTAESQMELEDIFNNVMDGVYLSNHLDFSKKYSNELMRIGDMNKLFKSLECAGV
ncbi:hypothetical protein A1359_10745 [Methylomonas lenta]|uniref:Polysaccharide pyruvyl transferase domain-containing protein n=1 Tax=Methylomonas lenta TaxID=980561 RepID=A0A177N9M2_9GAMM|nr:hypothetical protein [Methylomonas lenta]OAI14294.1 hypothetical protein A1359_10745 [Methylomonas lenta]